MVDLQADMGEGQAFETGFLIRLVTDQDAGSARIVGGGY